MISLIPILIHLLSMPPTIGQRFLKLYIQNLQERAESKSIIFSLLYIFPMLLHTFSQERHIFRLMTLLILQEDGFSLPDPDSLNKSLPLLLELFRHYENTQFNPQEWRVEVVLPMIESLEDQMLGWLSVYAGFQMLDNQMAQAELAIQKMQALASESNETMIVTPLFFYVTALALNEKWDAFDQYVANLLQFFKTDIVHPAPYIDNTKILVNFSDLFHNVKHYNVLTSPNDTRIEPQLDELTYLIIALLLQKQVARSLNILGHFTRRVHWQILYRATKVYKTNLLEDTLAQINYPHPITRSILEELFPLLQEVHQSAFFLLEQNILVEPVQLQDALDLIAISYELAQDFPTLSERLVNQLADESLKKRANDLFRNKRTSELQAPPTELAFHPLSSLSTEAKAEESSTLVNSAPEDVTSKLLNMVDNLLDQKQFMQAFEVVNQMRSLAARADILRLIAKRMAKQHHPESKRVFDEAIRIARANYSNSIAGSKSFRQELWVQKVAEEPAPIIALLDELNTGKLNYRRDMFLQAIVLGLIESDDLENAQKAAQIIHVDVWRSGAQNALISALLKQGEVSKARQIVEGAIGKANRFSALCVYGASLWHRDPADANMIFAKARQMIVSFQRQYHQLWAGRIYSTTLLRIEHPDAESSLKNTIETLFTSSDMLTRFYGLFDLLEDLFAINHPQANTLIKPLHDIIFEASDYSANLKDAPLWLRYSGSERIIQQVWQTVALDDTPAWELSALTDLAKLFVKYHREQALQQTLKLVEHFAKPANDQKLLKQMAIIMPQRLKEDILNVGSLSLGEVTDIMLTLNISLNQISPELSQRIREHVFRIFQWVEYDPRAIERHLRML